MIGADVKHKRFLKYRSDEAGMTTAEYAVGTVAAAGFGSILLKVLMSSEVRDLIARVIQHAFAFLFG